MNYHWQAHFMDGEEIRQYDGEGKEVLYREVLDRLKEGKQLSYIELVPVEKGPKYRQEIDSTWQYPVVFRRQFIKVNLANGEQQRHTVFALGWAAAINGQTYKSVLYIDAETGDILDTHRDW